MGRLAIGLMLLLALVGKSEAGKGLPLGVADIWSLAGCAKTDDWQPKVGERIWIVAFEPATVDEAEVTQSPSESCNEDLADSSSGKTFLFRLDASSRLGDGSFDKVAIALPKSGRFEIVDSVDVLIRPFGSKAAVTLRWLDTGPEVYLVAERAGKIIWKRQNGFMFVKEPRM